MIIHLDFTFRSPSLRAPLVSVSLVALSTLVACGPSPSRLATSSDRATGATYYMSPSGSDANPGTRAAPFQNLSKALPALRAGDTLVLMDGTYDETEGGRFLGDGTGGDHGFSSPGVLNFGGTSNAWITVMAENKGNAILDCQATTGPTTGCDIGFYLDSGADYWIFRDLVITRSAWGGISTNAGASHVKIQGVVIRNIGNFPDNKQYGKSGVGANPSAQDWTIDGCVFTRIGRTAIVGGLNHFDHGIYAELTNATIINNIFYENTSGFSIQIANGANTWLIANNTFAFNNKVTGEPGDIVFWNTNTNITVENNIFYQPVTTPLYNFTPNSTGVFDHNLVYGATATDAPPGVVVGSNNWMGTTGAFDPGFVSASPPYDLHVSATGPAVGRGVNDSSIFADDFDGNGRPSSGAWDVGAYIFGTTSSPTAPVVDFAPSSLSFAAQALGTTSPVQFVTVSNAGNATLNLGSVVFAGDFAPAGLGTCGVTAPVAPGSSCTISVQFTPTAAGQRSGSITLTDDASPSTQVVALSGIGGSSTPAVSLSPATLSFGDQNLGTTSSVQFITVSNTGVSTLNLSNVVFEGDFAPAGLGTCGVTVPVAPGSSCTISVQFTPTAVGPRWGCITLTDDDPTGTQMIGLSGRGAAPNLVQNAGFESGLSSWIDWGGSTVVSSPVHSGAYALEVGPASGGVGQNIFGLSPNQTYHFSAWAFMTMPSAQWASVQVAFQDASGNDLSGQSQSAHITGTSYALYALDVTAPSSFDHAQVRIWNNAGIAYVYVDDCGFDE
jgi:hypothetical protein